MIKEIIKAIILIVWISLLIINIIFNPNFEHSITIGIIGGSGLGFYIGNYKYI